MFILTLVFCTTPFQMFILAYNSSAIFLRSSWNNYCSIEKATSKDANRFGTVAGKARTIGIWDVGKEVPASGQKGHAVYILSRFQRKWAFCKEENWERIICRLLLGTTNHEKRIWKVKGRWAERVLFHRVEIFVHWFRGRIKVRMGEIYERQPCVAKRCAKKNNSKFNLAYCFPGTEEYWASWRAGIRLWTFDAPWRQTRSETKKQPR